ncbi:HEAT repeat domain-containing protein [Rhodohalobacter mucosus]|uniref:HEAT repeat protein n=1 Tax=Rhodohalobacter mucosus TaxID=2079485 RepID=A0A316TV27_9BACT|nr:HEAT repeat domain-containing protein [Rhodohalobacter mucosus]PWN07621.1 hypothetical protein DDZ15_05030 [Rhodohalobacter mucosus]
MKFKAVTGTLFAITYLVNSLFSQDVNWDYEAYPWMPTEFRHLDAELRISETGRIEGDILYSLSMKDEEADSLMLDAPGLEIIGVEVQNEPAENYISRDKLIIALPQRFERGQNLSLRIQYRSETEFGIHQSALGTRFTSSLPRSTSHWLPVVDHPSVEFTAEFMFIHPAGKKLVMNGREGEGSVVSVDEEVTVYSVNPAITPTGLNWALGDLSIIATTTSQLWQQETDPDIVSAFSGRSDSQIYLYSEFETDYGSDIITNSAQLLLQMQQETGISYPFRDLHLILLKDDYWETKPYGSGIIYLFSNRGNIPGQVEESIVSQWFGAKLRERQWSNPEAVQMLRGWQLSRSDYEPVQGGQSPPPYNVFESGELTPWIHFNETRPDQSAWDKKLSEVVGNLFVSGNYVLSYNTLAEEVYKVSGVPLFDGVTLYESVSQLDSVYTYTADIAWEAGSDAAEINFRAENIAVDELVSVNVQEITPNEVRSQQFTFTGESDTVVLSVSPFTENLILELPDSENVQLKVNKPFSFWLYQLRSSNEPSFRVEAAAKLAEYADNPDLQLALTDLLQREENAAVVAQILRSFSTVTNGAAGTQQLFLRFLDSGNPDSVRAAAIDGLSLFTGDEQVISRLRSTLYQSETSSVRRAATRSLYETTEPDVFLNILERSITDDLALNDVPYMLRLLADKGEQESAVRFAETFLSDNFPYEIRKGVLDLILQYDSSGDRWQARLQRLLFDRDPRIRYHSQEALKLLPSEAARDLLDRRLPEEYDERVRRKLQSSVPGSGEQ